MTIEPIVDTIKLILNKERKGMVADSKIKTAIQNAERDLFNELLNEYRKTGIVPFKLYPFISSTTGAFTAGSLAVATAQEVVSCEIESDSYYWDAKVARNNLEWTSRKFTDLQPDPEKPTNPMHKYMKTITVNNAATGTLPSNFIKEVGGFVTINGETFMAILLPSNKWGTKDIADVLPEGQQQSIENLAEHVYSSAELSTGSAVSPTGLIKPLSFSSTDADGNKWEGFLVPFSEFDSRNLKDLVDDKEIKKHLAITDFTVSLTTGVGKLPDEFIKSRGVFYAGTYEGLILDDQDFFDRANDDLLPPTTEYPIARMRGGEIEVLPNTITSIRIPGYGFPNKKNPVGAIGDGKFHIEPVPEGNVSLKYIQFPSARRPVYKIEADKVHVDPVQANDFTLVYYEYPTEKAPLVRFINGAVEVTPSTLNAAAVKVNFIKKITPSVYVWGTSGRNVTFTSGDSEFNEDSISDITAKALKYLGISIQDIGSTQFEKILNNDNAQ